MMRSHGTIRRLVTAVLLVCVLAVAQLALVACGSSESSAPDPNAPQISVSLKIDGTEGDHGIIFDKDVQVAEGANVYDALLASEVELSVKNNLGMGTYIAGIDGLLERSHGSESGWLYAVNGEQPSVSSEKYTVKDGDNIEWTYKINALDAS